MSDQKLPKNHKKKDNPWLDLAEEPVKSNAASDIDSITKLLSSFDSAFFANFLNFSFLKRKLPFIALIFFLLLFFSCFYVVKPDESTIVLRFGRIVRSEDSGLHFKLPSPIEKSITASTTSSRVIKIPSQKFSRNGAGKGFYSMLTFDENLVDIEFEIHWRIKNLEHFVLKVVDPEDTIYLAGESVAREVVGLFKLKDILTDAKFDIETQAKNRLQKLCDEYDLGVEVLIFQMLKADPPSEVISAFRDVQAARIEKESIVNKAYMFRNSIIPKAESDANKLISEAESFSVQVTNDAKSDILEFDKLYSEYTKNPMITRERMYSEALLNFAEHVKTLSVIDSSLKNIIFQRSEGENSQQLLSEVSVKKETVLSEGTKDE